MYTEQLKHHPQISIQILSTTVLHTNSNITLGLRAVKDVAVSNDNRILNRVAIMYENGSNFLFCLNIQGLKDIQA